MDQEMVSFIEWVKILLGFVGPIMVVWVTAKMTARQKEQETKHQDELEERKRKAEEMKEMIENLQKKVDNIDSDLTSVKKSVEEMERMDNKVHTDLAMLNRYHEVNVKHIQKVSATLVQLGEGLRDHNLDGKLTNSISELRNYEANMYTELFGRNTLATDGR